jgi:hypothetical protein
LSHGPAVCSRKPTLVSSLDYEIWPQEWSASLGGVERWHNPVAWGVFGKPVFRFTASSLLAGSLALERVQPDGCCWKLSKWSWPILNEFFVIIQMAID